MFPSSLVIASAFVIIAQIGIEGAEKLEIKGHASIGDKSIVLMSKEGSITEVRLHPAMSKGAEISFTAKSTGSLGIVYLENDKDIWSRRFNPGDEQRVSIQLILDSKTLRMAYSFGPNESGWRTSDFKHPLLPLFLKFEAVENTTLTIRDLKIRPLADAKADEKPAKK